MKLSVLVTFYNQAAYVDEALTSVFSQKTDFDFEVLIGDDGSTDGTLEKLQSWKDRYPDTISLYSMPREAGVSYLPSSRASRNRLNLLRHVKGTYFFFLDGDDYLCDPNKFQLQTDALEEPDHQDCVCCAHNVDLLFENQQTQPLINPAYGKNQFTLKQYWVSVYFHPDSMVIRSSVIPLLPLEQLDELFNDETITFAVLQHGSVCYLPRTMAVYRQTGEGIWCGRPKIISMIRGMIANDVLVRISDLNRCLVRQRFLGSALYVYRHIGELNDPAMEAYAGLANRYHADSAIKAFQIGKRAGERRGDILIKRLALTVLFETCRVCKKVYGTYLWKRSGDCG